MQEETKETKVTTQEKNKPDDNGGLEITTHVKIFDPETNEVLISKRGD